MRRSDDARNRSAHPSTAAAGGRDVPQADSNRSPSDSNRPYQELESHRRPAADTELIPRRAPALRPAARCEHVLSVGGSTAARRSWHLASFHDRPPIPASLYVSCGLAALCHCRIDARCIAATSGARRAETVSSQDTPTRCGSAREAGRPGRKNASGAPPSPSRSLVYVE